MRPDGASAAGVEAMLRERRVFGSCEFTHASMGGRLGVGKFYVAAQHSETFMAAYGECVDAGLLGFFSLVESHRHIGPVVVDIDLRQPGPERVYTAADAEAFAASLVAEVRRLVAPPSLRCFILEKPAPRPNKARLRQGQVAPSIGIRPLHPGFLEIPSWRYHG